MWPARGQIGKCSSLALQFTKHLKTLIILIYVHRCLLFTCCAIENKNESSFYTQDEMEQRMKDYL